jgi:hypothetical protein
MTPALRDRLRCADPTAYVHVDAVALTAEASKRTYAQWDAGTGAGWDPLTTGGARLTGSVGALVEHTSNTGYLTDLADDGTQFAAARIRWDGSESAALTIHRIKLYLHPKQDGGQPQEVARWRVRLWAVRSHTSTNGLAGGPYLFLVPLSDYVDVTAGASAALVTFDFSGLANPVLPKTIVCSGNPTVVGGEYVGHAVTFITVHALTATGDVAGNVGLGYDTGIASKTTAGNEITACVLTQSAWGPGGYSGGGSAGGTPRMAVDTDSFTAATATFEDAGNRLDLGATPTGTVEFILRGEVPPGTSLTAEVKNDADSAWVAFTDGSVSTDLAGVGKNQTYEVRVTLTPDSGGDVSPVVRVLGVREITKHSLANLTTLEGPTWKVDPVSFRGEIGEARLTVIRDGERDFRDKITNLLADHNVGNLVFEVWIADPNLARSAWLHVDTFVLDEYGANDAGITLTLLTHLSRLRQVLPRPEFLTTTGATLTFTARSGTTPARISRGGGSFVTDGYAAGDLLVVTGAASNNGSYILGAVTSTTILSLALDEDLIAEGPTAAPTLSAWVRRPYDQANATLKAVWDDLADNQLAIPARMRGPGVEDATTQVTNSIRDGDAKRALDAIAYLGGGGNISSQGRVKFVSMVDTQGIACAIPMEEITVRRLTPGLARRAPEIFVPYDWDTIEERFRGQVQGLNQTALTALGEAYIEPATVDDDVARWIATVALAQTVADRAIRYRGTGVMEWDFHSEYPWPELEPGDRMVVEVEPFVARDPFTAAAVRGRLWALGVVSSVTGALGPEFGLWIRQFADLLPTYTTYDLDPTAIPVVEVYFTPVLGNPGQLAVRLAAPFNATIKYAVQDWGSAVPDYGDAAYSTYTVPFQIGLLEDLDRQLVVYAERDGLRSPRREFRIDRNTDPSVTLTLSEPTAGTLRASWAPDDDVVFVRVYRKKNGAGNGWPTTNNNVDGPLDPAQLVATKYVRADGGEFDSTGAAVGPGGTQWEEAGYVGADVAKVIVVPFRTREHVGDRASASRTMAGAATANLTAFTTAQTAAGTTCGAAAEITVSWTPNAGVADVTHDLKIYRRRDGGDWTLVKTEASPASVTSYVDEVEDFESTGSGVWLNWQYRYELVDPAVIDSGQADPVTIESSGTCPLSS